MATKKPPKKKAAKKKGAKKKTAKKKKNGAGGGHWVSSIPHGANEPAELEARRAALYTSSADGLKAIREDYLYWTGKLTDSSFQLSLGIVAANWAAFGSVQKILSNIWAKTSLGIVIVTLGVCRR
jgi:hypothetical protein